MNSDVLWYQLGTSLLGRVLVAETEEGLCAVLPGDNDDTLLQELQGRLPRTTPQCSTDLQPLLEEVLALIDDPLRPVHLPLAPRGSEFQHRVWHALRALAPGTTTTYAALTASLQLPPTATRAVAGACGANPIAVLIPCHRVLRGDGHLAGYRWGLPRKRLLLDREARRTGAPLRPEALPLPFAPPHD